MRKIAFSQQHEQPLLPNELWPHHGPPIVAGCFVHPGLGPWFVLPIADGEPKGRVIGYDDFHCADGECPCTSVFIEAWQGGPGVMNGSVEPDRVLHLVGDLEGRTLRFPPGAHAEEGAQEVRRLLERCLTEADWAAFRGRRDAVRRYFASPDAGSPEAA